MKKLLVTLFLVAVCITGCASPAQRFLAERPAPEAVKLTEPERFLLPNELEVLFTPDPELPLVSVELIVPGGSLFDAPGEIGSMSALGGMMRDGGSSVLSPDEIDQRLDQLSAGIAVSVGAEFSTASFKCLSSDAAEMMAIFSDIVRRPRFDAKRFELWKIRQYDSIARRKEDAATIAALSFNQVLFNGTPYGIVPVSADVKKLDSAMLRRAHQRLFGPRGATITVTGGIARDAMLKLVWDHFGDWYVPSQQTEWNAPPVPNEPAPAVYFLTAPVSQAYVYIGKLGPKRFDKDHFPIQIYNELFGSTRISQRIRTELGLAYSAAAAIMPGAVRGQSLVVFGTKSESVGSAVREAFDVVARLESHGFTDDEVAQGLASVANTHIFKFESPGNVLERKVMKRIMGFPEQYDETFHERLAAVTAEEVNGLTTQLLPKSDLVIVAAGDEAAYQSLEAALKQGIAGYGVASIIRVPFQEKALLPKLDH